MLKVKKMFSTFVGMAMTVNALMTMPFSAFADEETSHTYTYDGYEVSYDVTNAWGNTEVVSVTLSNTGDSTIENWMLYFEPNGQVHNTVNVQEAQTSPEQHILETADITPILIRIRKFRSAT